MQGDDYTLGNVDDLDPSEWQVPPHCIPIHANVITYDWSKLSSLLQFDVIMMDPPWQLATANPTRGNTDAHKADCSSVLPFGSCRHTPAELIISTLPSGYPANLLCMSYPILVSCEGSRLLRQDTVQCKHRMRMKEACSLGKAGSAFVQRLLRNACRIVCTIFAFLAGVSLGYSQLTDADIVGLPVPELQSDGFLFIWVINAKYKFTLDLFQHWGYECVLPFPCHGKSCAS